MQSVSEIFTTFLNGGTLVLPDNEVRQSVEALTDLIATQNVTHANSASCFGRVDTNGLSFKCAYAYCGWRSLDI